LADNHQVELAEALQAQRYLKVLKISALSDFFETQLTKFVADKGRPTWVPGKPQRLFALIADETGYSEYYKKKEKRL